MTQRCGNVVLVHRIFTEIIPVSVSRIGENQTQQPISSNLYKYYGKHLTDNKELSKFVDFASLVSAKKRKKENIQNYKISLTLSPGVLLLFQHNPLSI